MPKVTDPALLARLNGGNVVASAPPMTKAPPGFAPGSLTIDPDYVSGSAQLAGAEASARAAASAAKDKEVAAYRARLQRDLLERQATLRAEEEKRKRGQIPPARAAELKDRLTALQNMENSLEELTGLYNRSFKGGGVGGLVEYLPGIARPENTQFDKLSKQMGPYIMSILGLSGKSTDAAAEYKQKVEPFIPSRYDRDAATEQTLGNLRRMLDTQKTATFKEAGIPLGAPRKGQKKHSRVVDWNELPE